MHAFSGVIQRSEHGAALPTVAQLDGDTLILSSSDGHVTEWPLNRVQIIEVGNGYFEVVAEDRRLSLIVEQPEAFGEALEAERAQRELHSGVKFNVPDVPEVGRPSATHLAPTTPTFRRPGLLSRRPRHGRASVRTLPLTVAVAAVVALGYLAGSLVGDVLDDITTEHPGVAETPRAEVKVRDFQGSEDAVTSPFVVGAPWEIRWSFEAPEGALLGVLVLGEDVEGEVVSVKERPGSGTVIFGEPGTYRLEIRPTAGGEWTVSVVEVANAASG